MKLLTLTEAAGELGITRRRLRGGIQRGAYPALKWGNRLLVDIEAVRPIIESEQAEGLIGLSECAELIGLKPESLRRMAKAGLVPYRRSGRRYRFVPDDVVRAIREKMTRDDGHGT